MYKYSQNRDLEMDEHTKQAVILTDYQINHSIPNDAYRHEDGLGNIKIAYCEKLIILYEKLEKIYDQEK